MNNFFKKALIGTTCAGILLTGGLTLGGCSLTEEQQNAINTLTQNTETLVNDFGAYLDGQNAKIDKEKAAEIIARSRLNFLMGNFDNLEMNAAMNMYNGFEDVLVGNGNATIAFKSEDNNKIMYSSEDGVIVELQKSDFNNNVHYTWTIENGGTFKNCEYTTGMWSTHSMDIFSQSPINYIGDITAEEIYNIKTIENGYEFELVAGFTTLQDTDVSKYEENEKIDIINMIMNIRVENELITKIDFKCVQANVPISGFAKDTTKDHKEILVDEKGLPVVFSYDNAEVVTMIMDVKYKYDNISFSAVESKIAAIEDQYLS